MPHLLKKQKYSFVKVVCKYIANILTPRYHNYYRWELRNKFLRYCGFKIGNKVVIDKNFFVLHGLESNVIISDYAVINPGCRMMSFNTISIGKFCLIAADVSIVNGGHNKDSYEPYSSSVSIGNGVWIGYRATIVAKENNLKIGNNVIIGAGALVIKNIPDNAIVAGVPGKIIGHRKLPDKVRHIGNTYYSPKNFSVLASPNTAPATTLTEEDVISNSILTHNDVTGDGGVKIIAACVTNKNREHTLNVPIGEELNFHIAAQASRTITKPYFSIALYNKNKGNELVFTGTTVQIGDYSKKMERGDKVIIGFKVKMTIEAGEYTFRLSCAEPTKEHHPNKGNSLEAHNLLGPITVSFDYEQDRAPFYGIAQLPMEML